MALGTIIPLNKDYLIFLYRRLEKNVRISKKDIYLKLANVPVRVLMENGLCRSCQQISYLARCSSVRLFATKFYAEVKWIC